MTLASDLTGARIVLWPGTGNDWYGFGMNGSTMNYNVITGATHKSYCSTAVCATISSTATTFNNAVTCGSNSFTCGTLTCTTGTLGGNTIATTNLIPSLTGYATLASPIFTGTVSKPGATSTGVLTFPITMPLGADLTGARIVLYLGTGNE